MTKDAKSKDVSIEPKPAHASVSSPEQNDSLEITDADEKAGAEMMEKILNAIKDMPNVEETSIVDKDKEFQEKLARQQADFDNYRKRMEKEKQEIVSNANANLISEILPTLDHFELALKHNKDKGVEMIYDELNEILKNNGVKIINTKGTFNPRLHEAVVKVDGEEDGKILEEIQKGYLLNEKLLRASKVKVSRVTEKK
jgi:molecular chaperone GrpE